MDLRGRVDDATLARLDAAKTTDVSRTLRIGQLKPGDVGVLRATVASIAPPRTFSRKNGTEGIVGRVTFHDGTGEADAVLWDDMNRLTRDGTLAVGKQVTLRGAMVDEGWRGGIEISLEAADIEVQDVATSTLRGQHVRIEPTHIVDGRFQAEWVVQTPDGEARVMLWDDLVKEARSFAAGQTVELAGAAPHPLLDGWYLADGAQFVQPATQP